MLRAVNCRACGETNFVEVEDQLVQLAIPVDIYKDVIRLIRRRTGPTATKPRDRRVKYPPEAMEQVAELRKSGLTLRATAEKLGMPLTTVYRIDRRNEEA